MNHLGRDEKSCSRGSQLLFEFNFHHLRQFLIYRCIEIEVREILSVIADANSFLYFSPICASTGDPLEQRALADAVGAREQQVLILLELEILRMLFRLMVFERRIRSDLQDDSPEIFLRGDEEVTDSLIFFSHIHLRLLRFLYLVAHFLRDEAHLASLLSEEVHFLLAG